tara:strand:- start:855 stop:1184 length:330 start_codon:yes stop_codon:yes gene_type:complete
MSWASAWIFLKEVPARVWAGVIWVLCIVGWWLTRSELAKEKAENAKLKARASEEKKHRLAIVKLQERKERIANELKAAKDKAKATETKIFKMDEDRLVEELNNEFGDDS